MPLNKILLAGATGYIGGTVLHKLLSSEDPALANVNVSALVRGHDRATKLRATYGNRVTCVLFKGYDDTHLLSQLASEHDIVINAGSGFDPESAEAMVRGLSRRDQGNSPGWMIHTSGCTNISDLPMTHQSFPDREFNDADGSAVYEFERAENQRYWYPQRAAELAVIDTGLETGVDTVSIMPPLIFGVGEGHFNRSGLMNTIMMNYVLAHGYGFSLGDGTGAMEIVHVSDLADLYVLCVLEILKAGGGSLPRGKDGIIFATNGRINKQDIAWEAVNAAFAAGVLPREGTPQEKMVKQLTLEEVSVVAAGNMAIAEMGWAGHELQTGTVAKIQLGWNPFHGVESWREDFAVELRAIQQGKGEVKIDNCILAGEAT